VEYFEDSDLVKKVFGILKMSGNGHQIMIEKLAAQWD